MTQYHIWKKKLKENQKQWDAFTKCPHTVVIAGPGSGKTRVLSVKIAQLLRNEIPHPRGVACLTYTRMMAKELENRLFSLGIPYRPNIFVGTIHGFCLGQVIQPFADLFELGIPTNPTRIAPMEAWNNCLNQAMQDTLGKSYDPDEDKNFVMSLQKYHRQHIDIDYPNWDNQEYANLLKVHYDLLFSFGYVDFDIIIKGALQLIIESNLIRQSLHAKFPWIAVDEYQDLGYPLYRIVTKMIEKTPIKLFAIGDPDQTIFDFSGTDPKYLIELTTREDVQPVIGLDINYRSTEKIIDISKAHNPPYCDYYADSTSDDGRCRVYECPNDNGQRLKIVSLIKEYLNIDIPIDRIAILHPWRENRDGTVGINLIARTLYQENIPFILDKHPLYDQRMILINWLENLGYWCLLGWEQKEQVKNRVNYEDILRTWGQILSPSGGNTSIDTKNKMRLTKTAWKLRGKDLLLGEWLDILFDDLSMLDVLSEYEKVYPDEVNELKILYEVAQPEGTLAGMKLSIFVNLVPGVQLTTLHSSKGLEFKVVIIAGVERIRNDANGRRLLYVGMTRAEKEICLLYTKVWPQLSPETPQYVRELVNKCNHLDYFHHYNL